MFLESTKDHRESFLVKREVPEIVGDDDLGPQTFQINENSGNLWKSLEANTYYFPDLNYIDNLKLN